MYLGVDIGGSKTLIAAIEDNGIIKEEVKFPTDKDYYNFRNNLEQCINNLNTKDFRAGVVAVTGPRIDRTHGRMINSSNLPWRNIPIQRDLEQITKCPINIENDAKLAALSESMLLKDKYEKVLYVTISTGIGYGLINKLTIDENVGDAGGRSILLEYKDKLTPWEDFASGRALVERFGKKAKDIKDNETWKIISRDLAKGFIHLIAVMQPDIIVIGGSVGNYFERYNKFLIKDIENYNIPLVKIPVIIKAQRPDEAVVYGCYDLAKQRFPL